jgi:hypothetical protein
MRLKANAGGIRLNPVWTIARRIITDDNQTCVPTRVPMP